METIFNEKKIKASRFYSNSIALKIFQIAIASGVSWELAKLAGSHHPYLAPLTVILSMQSTIVGSIRFSIKRIIGTIIGVLLIVLAAEYLPVNGLTIALLILFGGYIVYGLKMDETVIHQTALTILLVFIFEQSSGHYAVDRIRDTLIGAGTAVLIQFLLNRANHAARALKMIDRSSHQLSVSFELCAEWLEDDCSLTRGLQLKHKTVILLESLGEAEIALDYASESVKFNLFQQKNKKEMRRMRAKIEFQKEGYKYLVSTIDTFLEWSSSGYLERADRRIWGMHLQAVSHYFESMKSTTPAIKYPYFAAIHPVADKKDRYHIVQYHTTEQFMRKIGK